MLWVGTYRAKGGQGLYPVEIDGANLQVGAPETGIVDASFAVWDRAAQTAYFVAEQNDGRVTSWRRDGSGWRRTGEQASGGALPCYLALDRERRLLAVANYGDGTIALLRIGEGGEVADLLDRARQDGSGPDRDRPAGPHAHCALFDPVDRSLLHVDLGLDRVFRYATARERLGQPETAFEAPPGSGPRHLLFHPDGRHALLLCELSAELLLLERSGPRFALRHAVKTCPEAEPADNLGGHLALAGDRVLVTNRGHDSLVAFAIAGGRLERGGWTRTGGKSPRHLHPVGERILVAHEEGGSVAWLELPDRDGAAGTPETARLPGAAFVLEVVPAERAARRDERAIA